MTAAEQQTDELEALKSIFDGDSAFSITSTNSIQYRFGDDGQKRSFLLEFIWPPSYPIDEIPRINLDLFFNKHLSSETKSIISKCLLEEAEILRGSPMTYSLIEIVKERFEQLTENQVKVLEPQVEDESNSENELDDDNDQNQGRTRTKAEKLTKAQKRKQWDRGQAIEKPRGWNWVDIVKHLSQTGN